MRSDDAMDASRNCRHTCDEIRPMKRRAAIISPPFVSSVRRRLGLHKDSCKSGHRTRMEVLPRLIRAVFGGIIFHMARLIRAVRHDSIG